MASHMSAGRALELGYRRVFVMTDGTLGWRSQGFALEACEDQAGA
jgi:hypothetical protein